MTPPPRNPAGFDLRALIRDVASTSSDPDPAAVALEVLRRIPRTETAIAAALAQALPPLVRDVCRDGRGGD